MKITMKNEKRRKMVQKEKEKKEQEQVVHEVALKMEKKWGWLG